MTSVLRKYSQIEPRMAYFLTLVSPLPAWTMDASGSVSSLMSITEFTANMSYDTSGNFYDISGNLTPVPVGSLLKDLGRQITVYDSAQVGYPHVAVFRQVLYVGQTLVSETEGIGYQLIFYVCVWAQETQVGTHPFMTSSVVRTG